mgnify:FL=1
MNFKELILKYKPIIILSVIVALLVALNFYLLFLLNQEEDIEEDVVITEETEEDVKKIFKVDIKGQINKPGLYEVEEGSRVMDVINKAGGLTDNADTSVINLSKKVKDEMVILVYSKAEVEKLKEDEQEPIIVCPEVNDACVTDELEEPLIPKEEETSEGVTSTGKVSLNTATLEELQTLDGIGESKAQAIIDYRTQNGPFETIEQLKEVSGIGDSTFEKIKDKITT